MWARTSKQKSCAHFDVQLHTTGWSRARLAQLRLAQLQLRWNCAVLCLTLLLNYLSKLCYRASPTVNIKKGEAGEARIWSLCPALLQCRSWSSCKRCQTRPQFLYPAPYFLSNSQSWILDSTAKNVLTSWLHPLLWRVLIRCYTVMDSCIVWIQTQTVLFLII